MTVPPSKERARVKKRESALSDLRNLRASTLAWTLVLAIVLTAAGGSIGHLGAQQLVKQQALTELDAASERVIRRFDDILFEATEIFGQLENQELPRCSEEQLLHMRTQVFNARFLRDIGRIEDLALYCSSALGDLDTPYQSGPPDLSIDGRLGLKTDREVLAGHDTRTMVVESDSFNALVDPAVVTDLAAAMDSAELFLSARATDGTDLDWHPFHRAYELSGNGLSSERCSAATGLCILLHVPDSRIADWHPQTRVAMAGLGGAAGLAVFLVIFMGLRQEDSAEKRLRQALRQEDIRTVYQPIIRLPERQLVGVEALARWTDGNGETIPAEHFITLAEQCGLIGKISELMIRNIGEELSPWLKRHRHCVIAINIAPAELNDQDLLDKLDRELIGRGILAEQIVLEITERTMVENESARVRIEQLSQRGYRIYADDFGVGYCGLAYLNDMDVHGIKISELFTAAVSTDSPKAALVPRITELARELGLDVIIEGLETAEQAQSLAPLEPILVQGWLFSRGIAIDELLRRFDQNLSLAPDP
jgi:sensor c-di-GMP phosphodiesterase-like protein